MDHGKRTVIGVRHSARASNDGHTPRRDTDGRPPPTAAGDPRGAEATRGLATASAETNDRIHGPGRAPRPRRRPCGDRTLRSAGLRDTRRRPSVRIQRRPGGRHWGPLPVPVWTIATLQLLSIPLGTAVNSVLAFGEEVGWRGWLLPALLPLGTWPALIITGVLWGAWHAPIILLGYNFDEPNLVGVGLMIIATTLIGVLVGWLRMRSASLWPAVFAHGALNAAGGLVTLFAAQEESVDPILAGPLGVGSWIAFTIVVVVLVLTRQLPHHRSKLGKGGSWSRSAPLTPDRRPAPPGRSPRSAHNRGPGGR